MERLYVFHTIDFIEVTLLSLTSRLSSGQRRATERHLDFAWSYYLTPAVINEELKKTTTVSGTGRSLNKILMSRAIAVHVRYNSSIVRYIAAFCKTT